MKIDIGKLIQLSEQKLRLLNDILVINDKLNIAINSKNLDDIKNLLFKKQSIINNINNIDTMFIPRYKLYKKVNKLDSIFDIDKGENIEKSKLKGKLIDIKSVLLKIKDKDDENLRDLSIFLKKTETNINDIKNSKKVYIEYIKYYSPDSYFMDKKR